MVTETLTPQLIESLSKSVKEILETMVAMTPTSMEPVAHEHSHINDPVIGLLGFTGTKSGTFVVRTSEALARQMAANMLMMTPEELTDFAEVEDAFGEVVNMMSGGFKNEWVASGNQMELSCPNVIHNGSVTINSEDAASVRSGVRATIDGDVVDIGVHFEA